MKKILIALFLCVKRKSSEPYKVWYPASKLSGLKTLLPIFPRVLIVSKTKDERTGQYVVGCVTFKYFWPNAEAYRVDIPEHESSSVIPGTTKFLYPIQTMEVQSEKYEELLKESLLEQKNMVHMLLDEEVTLEQYQLKLAVISGDGTELPTIFA